MTRPNWHKVRVWYSARHKWSGIVHIAARGKGNLLMTRCGIRTYVDSGGRKASKGYRLFDWGKGRSPVTPTCGHCLRLHRQDMEEINTIGRGEAIMPVDYTAWTFEQLARVIVYLAQKWDQSELPEDVQEAIDWARHG